MVPDSARVTTLIREAAEAEILPRFGRLAEGEIREKGPGDIVTDADTGVERRLTSGLMELVPGSVVVGEEAVAAEPSLLRRLSEDSPVWAIDPIDGTSNFVAGIPLFAVMVAYVERNTVLAGWIHDPVENVTYAAEAGAGAWAGGRRLRVAQGDALERMSGRVGFRSKDRDLVARTAFKSRRFASILNLRCAGQEYAALVSGKIHFSLYHRLTPWDHAAGVLIHREAGGYGACLDGRPWRPADDGEGLLLAPDRESWESIAAFLLTD